MSTKLSSTTEMAQLTGVGDDGSRAMSMQVERAADQGSIVPSGVSFDDHFEITRTWQQVVDGSYSSVALQFPDELLPAAPRVVSALQVSCLVLRIFPIT